MGGEWAASYPCHFTPGEIAPSTHWIGGWVGLRASMDMVVKTKKKSWSLPGIEAQLSSL